GDDPRQGPPRAAARSGGARLPCRELLDHARIAVGARRAHRSGISLRLFNISHPPRPLWPAGREAGAEPAECAIGTDAGGISDVGGALPRRPGTRQWRRLLSHPALLGDTRGAEADQRAARPALHLLSASLGSGPRAATCQSRR